MNWVHWIRPNAGRMHCHIVGVPSRRVIQKRKKTRAISCSASTSVVIVLACNIHNHKRTTHEWRECSALTIHIHPPFRRLIRHDARRRRFLFSLNIYINIFCSDCVCCNINKNAFRAPQYMKKISNTIYLIHMCAFRAFMCALCTTHSTHIRIKIIVAPCKWCSSVKIVLMYMRTTVWIIRIDVLYYYIYILPYRAAQLNMTINTSKIKL